MKPGDRVRVLKSTEEGIISRIVDHQLIEVEIEDGFSIPVLKNEVVIISSDESAYFGNENEVKKENTLTEEKFTGKKGLFLALIPVNDRLLSAHFINNTCYDLLVHLATKQENDCYRLTCTFLGKRQTLKLHDLDRSDYDQWDSYYLQAILSQAEKYNIVPAYEKEFKLKASKLFKESQPVPLLEKTGYLYHINADRPF